MILKRKHVLVMSMRNKETTHVQHLEWPIYIHFDGKSYSYDVCGKQLKQQEQVKGHIYIRTGKNACL